MPKVSSNLPIVNQSKDILTCGGIDGDETIISGLLTFRIQRCFALFTMLVVQGCGVAYVSPTVTEVTDAVTVVPLSPETLAAANQSSYVPREVPRAFSVFATPGEGSAVRGAAVLPVPQGAPQPVNMQGRLPPDVSIGPYQIGVGDVVVLIAKAGTATLDVPTAQNARESYTVQGDGMISIPALGRVALAGLTLAQAETHLFESFANARIDPTFSLDIAAFNAASVIVGGAVAAPANVPITATPLYLDAALTRAGGIVATDPAYASIRIYRDDALYHIPLAQYLSDPNLHKIRLLGGDSIYVDTTYSLDQAQRFFEQQIVVAQLGQQAQAQALAALTAELDQRRAVLAERRSVFQERLALDAVERDYVYLTGEVSAPGRFTLPFGHHATLADALFSEGGFSSETANPAQIYVLRADETGAVTAWQLDARNVANLVLATRMTLISNDIIFIAEQPVTRWHRVVQQIVPSLISSGAGLAAN